MYTYYLICFFILGTVLGSFYNVVGWRLPKGESLVKPSSHCPNCNHKLRFWELIPIISFFIQGRKCTSCKQRISWFYPIFEFMCGILFSLSFAVFGLTWQLLIALTFISMLIIVMVSDYNFMIIPDEVLLFFGILLGIEILFINGYDNLIISLGNGVISTFAIYLLKLFGDFIFKKESMGGGDIKLLFLFGMMLGWPLAVISIFLGSLVGLPISLVLMRSKNNHEIPFGPYLSVGALIILLTRIDFNWIMILLTK